MTTRVTKFGLLGAFAVSFAAFACESGGVGDPCIPDDEYSTNVGGFTVDQVTVETRSFQCATRVCLVNKFQGRVSCPYGADDAHAQKFHEFILAGDEAGALNYVRTVDPTTGELPRVCKVPNASGDSIDDYVDKDVEAQDRGRAPADAVYCSCRCANHEGVTTDGANYCECPSGFGCTKLVDYIGLGDPHLAGSYCVRDGTQDFSPGALCVAEQKNCSEGQYLAQ